MLCPERGLRIVAGGVCIREAIAGNGRGTGSAVGDCGSLRAGAGRVRGKAAVADTADDAGFGCPKDGVIVVSAFRNIRKRARGGLRLRRAGAQPETVDCVGARERLGALQIGNQLLRGLLCLLCHCRAVLGGKLAGVRRRLQRLHGNEIAVEFLLQVVQLRLDILPVRVADELRAVGRFKVAHVVVENFKAPVVGFLPALGQNPVAVGRGDLAGFAVVRALGIGVEQTAGRLFGGKLHGRRACLVALIHGIDQHRIIRHKDVACQIADCDPTDRCVFGRAVFEHLEDFNLLIAGLCDGAELVVVQNIVDIQRPVGGDVRVERDNRAGLVKIGNRKAAVVGD